MHRDRVGAEKQVVKPVSTPDYGSEEGELDFMSVDFFQPEFIFIQPEFEEDMVEIIIGHES